MKLNILITALLLYTVSGSVFAQRTDKANEEGRGAYKTRVSLNMEKYWDSDIVRNNPHKGWESHSYDKG